MISEVSCENQYKQTVLDLFLKSLNMHNENLKHCSQANK